MSDAPVAAAPTTPAPSSAPASAPSSGSAPQAAPTRLAPTGTPQHPDNPVIAGAGKTTGGDVAPPAPPPKARKYQIKVDGKVQEIDFDSMKDEDLVKKVQLAEAAQRRMQEAAELRKKYEPYEKNPLSVLDNPETWAEARKRVEDQILREYEESQLAEPERKLKQQERALAEREAKLKAFEEQQQQHAQRQLEERVFQETQKQFSEAIEAEGLPRNRETIALMAEIAQFNLENGIDLTPKQLAVEVRGRLSELHTNTIKGMKGEALMRYLGDDTIKEVLQFAVEQVKAQQNAQAFKPPEAVQEAEPVVGEGEESPASKRRRDMQAARKFFRR